MGRCFPGDQVSTFRLCDGRVERPDGSWLPCELPAGHGIDKRGFGCTVTYRGTTAPTWNPRDRERRKAERRQEAPNE